MLNFLLPGTKSAIHRHTDTSELVVCIYGSAFERFHDKQGNGSDESGSDFFRHLQLTCIHYTTIPKRVF